MKLVILFLSVLMYANCTLGLLAALAGLGARQAPAPSHGPIIITSNYESDDSGPSYIPYPIYYPAYGYGGYGGYGAGYSKWFLHDVYCLNFQ